MRALALILASTVPALEAQANEAFLAAETLTVQDLKGPLPPDVSAPIWGMLPSTVIWTAPQRTVRLHDRDANAALAAAAPKPVKVRAATNLKELALVLEWTDDTETRIVPDETAAFGDSAAIELPLQFGAGTRLPYVGMGDAQQHVALYLQRAASGGGVVGRELVAKGFGSSTRAELGRAKMSMRYDARSRTWRALFVRSLRIDGHDLGKGLVPFAVAIWDGAKNERGGNKSISGWRFLRLTRFPLDAEYVDELAFGYHPGDLGDPARGKPLVESVCAACHHLGDKRMAAPGIAPDLSYAGVVDRASYLRDSIINPSAVLVPHLNPNQHYSKAAEPDANRAYPNNPQYQWHSVGADGKLVSKMPPLGALDVASIVAFLKTLGVPPEEKKP